jgi:T5SS/PEP-CTERM-associated repeat protein
MSSVRPPRVQAFAPAASVLLTFALVALAGPASATNRFWNSAGGGLASVGANWSPIAVPSSVDDTWYQLAGTYTVFFDADVPEVNSHAYRAGSVSLYAITPHTSDFRTSVGWSSGDIATLNVISGQFLNNGEINVGRYTGTTGTLNISDPDASLETVGSNKWLYVGGTASGSGALNITNGGYVNISGSAPVAMSAGSIGAVTVSGVNNGVTDTRSTFQAFRTGTSLFVGQFGQGSLDVLNGGLVSCSSVRIGDRAGSSGVATVQGSLLGFSATIDASSLYIGSGTCPSFGGGDGLLLVNSGGLVDVYATTRVGDACGGFGTLQVVTGGRVETGGLIFDDGNSSFNFDGGTVRVQNNGTFDPAGTSFTLNSAAGTPIFELAEGADAAFSASVPDRALAVGTTARGAFRLFNAGTTCAVTGDVGVGESAGSVGSLSADSTSTFTATGIAYVGASGTGSFLVQNGAHATVNHLFAGIGIGGVGAVTVQGTGADLAVSSMFTLGGTSSPPPSGTLTVANGGIVHAGSPTIYANGGTAVVNTGGSFTCTGTISHRGVINMGGGTLTANIVDFVGAASLTGNGTVNARILADDALATITASGGNLTLGDPISTLGFVNLGTMGITGQTVTLRDLNAAEIGNVTMSTGTLVFPSGGSLAAGKTISGKGTLSGALANSGTLAPAGAGLLFSGMLTDVGQGISGSLVNFLSGGGYTGTGTLACQVDGDAGSVITAIGNLTMGIATFNSGVTLDGQLIAGSHTVTLLDANGVGLGSLTSIAGGALVCAQALTMSSTDVLSGTGVVSATTLTNGGTVSPGASAGRLRIAANYTQTAGGHLAAEIGNHSAGEWDTLAVTGAATLAGALDVTTLPSFVASPGDSFPVVTFASRSGAFTSFLVNGGDPAGVLDIVYTSTEVVLVVPQAPVGVETAGAPPAELQLTARAHSGGDAAFHLDLPRDARVWLRVFDLTGREVALLCDREERAGRHTYSLAGHGPRLASGVYFGLARVRSEGAMEVRRARVCVVR